MSRRSLLFTGAAALGTWAIGDSVLAGPFARLPVLSTSSTIDGFVSDQEKQAVDRLVEAFVNYYSLPGFSMAMAYRGELKLIACNGYANKAREESVTPEHVFRVASVSKPITGATIVKLVEDKKLELQSPIFGRNGLLKDIYDTSRHRNAGNRERLEKLTVLHLLEHTGGGWGNSKNDPMFVTQALSMSHERLIKWTLDQIPLERDPGDAYDYSNFGYCLLGRVIEAVTGQRYEVAVKEMLLAPAGITKMGVASRRQKARLDNEVTYYQEDEDPYGKSMNVNRMDAHGGWVASPTDLVRLLIHIDGFDQPKDILSPESIELMTTPSSPSLGYAKGWSVNADKNWWHQGSFAGGSSFLARIADGHCWAIVVNTRSKNRGYTEALDQLPWHIKQSIKDWGEGDLFESTS